jgi:hypothetical protein
MSVRTVKERRSRPRAGNQIQRRDKKGAMPWHHQYIGNPFLTWLFNKANKSQLSDTHSGF